MAVSHSAVLADTDPTTVLLQRRFAGTVRPARFKAVSRVRVRLDHCLVVGNVLAVVLVFASPGSQPAVVADGDALAGFLKLRLAVVRLATRLQATRSAFMGQRNLPMLGNVLLAVLVVGC